MPTLRDSKLLEGVARGNAAGSSRDFVLSPPCHHSQASANELVKTFKPGLGDSVSASHLHTVIGVAFRPWWQLLSARLTAGHLGAGRSSHTNCLESPAVPNFLQSHTLGFLFG